MTIESRLGVVDSAQAPGTHIPCSLLFVICIGYFRMVWVKIDIDKMCTIGNGTLRPCYRAKKRNRVLVTRPLRSLLDVVRVQLVRNGSLIDFARIGSVRSSSIVIWPEEKVQKSDDRSSQNTPSTLTSRCLLVDCALMVQFML